MSARFAAAVAMILVALVIGPSAQEPKPAFEVVSVKPRPGAPQGITTIPFSSGQRPGGILDLPNTTVARLIMYAYDLRDFQVDGGPEWLRVDRFDVSGRAGGELPVATLRLMVQSLLADRFKLAAHEVQREMPVYSLVLARAGELGPSLKRNDDECKSKVETPKAPPESRNAIRSAGCGLLGSLVATASAQMGGPVIDKTGLAGNFQWSLYWDGQGRFFGEPESALIPTREPNLPLYPAALQEQLGLKLESSRGPVKVLIVDSVQRPTEN